MKEYEDIDVDVQTITKLVVLGFAEPLNNGHYRLTAQGKQWFNEWVDKLRNHPFCMCETQEEGWRPCPPSLCEIPNHLHEETARD